MGFTRIYINKITLMECTVVNVQNINHDFSHPFSSFIIDHVIRHSPLAQFRADPFVAYNEQDGMYYLTGSNLNEKSASGGGAYNAIILRRSDSINGLTDAKEADIWKNKTIQVTDERKDVITGWYWAPELHFIGRKWRILAMGTVKSTVNGVIQNDGWAQCVFSCK